MAAKTERSLFDAGPITLKLGDSTRIPASGLWLYGAGMFFKKSRFNAQAHEEAFVTWMAMRLQEYFETESVFDPHEIGLILNEEGGDKKIHPLRPDGYFIALMNGVLKKSNWFGRRRFWSTLIHRFRELEEGVTSIDPVELSVFLETWRQYYRNENALDIFEHVSAEELITSYAAIREELVKQRFNATFGIHESLDWVVEDLTLHYLERFDNGGRWSAYEWALFVFNYFGHVDRMRFIVTFNLAIESSNLLLETDPDLHQRVMWQAVPDLFYISYLYRLAYGDAVVDYNELVQIGISHQVHEKSDVAQVFAEHGFQMGDGIPFIRMGSPGELIEEPEEPTAQDIGELSQEMPIVVGIEGNMFWDPLETSRLEKDQARDEGSSIQFFPGERLGIPLASYAEGDYKLTIHDNLGPDRTMNCDASRHLFSMLVGESPSESSLEVMQHLPFRAGIYVIYREGQGSAFVGYWIDGWSQEMTVGEDEYEAASRDSRASWSLSARAAEQELGAIWQENAEGFQAMPILFETH